MFLFRRLVEITTTFTNRPSLSNTPRFQKTDHQILVTPSQIGNIPLSAKAIPYYYSFNSTTPLYRLWNQELTERSRANHNMAYRSFEYQPPAPGFIQNALAHDLEAYNFLRVEGHIGKHYKRVLRSITEIRDARRLSFDVVALRTGELSEDVAINLSKYECHFNDLEAMYDALRYELICLAKKSLAAFGKRPHKRKSAAVAFASDKSSNTSKPSESNPAWNWFDLMTKELFSEPETMGALFATRVRLNGFNDVNVLGEPTAVVSTLNAMVALVRFTANLADDLQTIDWDEFEDAYHRLKKLSEDIGRASSADAEEESTFKELNQQIVSVVYACRIEGFISIRDEYTRRLAEIKRLQFFSEYIKEYPDVQHKAGVPVGGTFIIVYHDDSNEEERDTPQNKLPLAEQLFGKVEFMRASAAAARGHERTTDTVQAGKLERAREASRRAVLSEAEGDAFERLFDDMPNGTVIADFFLPYRCCSDCPPIQFVVSDAPEPPVQPPSLTAQLGCTTAAGLAEVTLTVNGGKEPMLLSIDGAAGISLPVSIRLTTGPHTLLVTDADDASSAPVSVLVPQALQTTTPAFTDNPDTGTYVATFSISGGTAPYSVTAGIVSGSSVTVGPIDSGNAVTVLVTDSNKCVTSVTLQHNVETVCNKPCDGLAKRCRYPVWAPRPAKGQPYSYANIQVASIRVSDSSGATLIEATLTNEVRAILQGETSVTDNTYDAVMDKVCVEITRQVSERIGDDSFILKYDPVEAGTLTIEHYVCHTFSIKIDYTTSSQDGQRQENWEYTPDSCLMRQRSPSRGAYKIQAFGCIELNKCLGTTGKDCKVGVKSIVPKQSPNGIQLSATLDESVDPTKVNYFWRVDSPGLLVARTPEVLIPVDAAVVRAQLLVVDNNGCWFFGEATFNTKRVTPVRFIVRPR